MTILWVGSISDPHVKSVEQRAIAMFTRPQCLLCLLAGAEVGDRHATKLTGFGWFRMWYAFFCPWPVLECPLRMPRRCLSSQGYVVSGWNKSSNTYCGWCGEIIASMREAGVFLTSLPIQNNWRVREDIMRKIMRGQMPIMATMVGCSRGSQNHENPGRIAEREPLCEVGSGQRVSFSAPRGTHARANCRLVSSQRLAPRGRDGRAAPFRPIWVIGRHHTAWRRAAEGLVEFRQARRRRSSRRSFLFFAADFQVGAGAN